MSILHTRHARQQIFSKTSEIVGWLRFTGLMLAGVLLLLAAAPGIAGADEPGSAGPVKDLSYGDALFEFYRGDYFDSATKLLVAQQQGSLTHHADDAELLLGGLYLSYGQQDAAAQIFESLLHTTSPEVRDRAWLYLAEIAWQRGNNERAASALARMGEALDDEFIARRQLLEARLAIEEERFDDAVDLLARWEGGDQLAAYAQFNLGVAMIRRGDVDRGSSQLAQIGKGRIRPPGTSRFRIPERWRFWSAGRRSANAKQDEHRALRDKANLALGFAHLQQQQAPQAMQFLQRVSNASELSSKARLGAGWAATELGNYTTALGHWNRLKGQDRLDPAVQEALLAIPFAHRRLGKDQQAIDEYHLAIEQFEAEIAHLDTFQQSLDHGDFLARLLADDNAGTVGWFWQLAAVPDSPESRYLYHLVADHAFQEGLKNYRDVLFLRDNLNNWKNNLAAYRTIVEAQRSRYAKQMKLQPGSGRDAQLTALSLRVDSAREQLQRIRRENDAAALANAGEIENWQRLSELGERLARIDSPKAESARQKQRFLRGVMLWDLEQDYPERLWEKTKQVRELEKQVALGEQRLAKLGAAKQQSPERFAGFDARIDAAVPRIDRLLDKASRALGQHEQYLADLAGEQFDRHRQRLTAYLTEAQFALASAYDESALAQESP